MPREVDTVCVDIKNEEQKAYWHQMVDRPPEDSCLLRSSSINQCNNTNNKLS